MKSILFICARVFVVCLLAAALSGVSAAQDKDKDKDKGPQISKGEQEAAGKVQAAPDTATKLKAAGEFIKKYPKSTQRAAVVSTVVDAIIKTPAVANAATEAADDAKKIIGLENALTVFKEPADVEIINPILFSAYIKANRVDDAFTFAQKDLASNPNDLTVLTQATMLGTDQAKKQNGKYVPQSQQYGAKAIQIIESGNKPASISDESWKDYQTRWLPQLYQALGLLSLMTQNPTDARAKLEKAAALKGDDPFTYYLLGTLINEEYTKIREDYQKQSPGPLKDSLLRDAQAKIDEVIEMWAHSIALAQGDATYVTFAGQLRPELESYYKSRHAGTTNGLDALITKYKKQ